MQLSKVPFAALAAAAAMVSQGLASSASPLPSSNLVSGATQTRWGYSQSNNWSGYNQGIVEKKTLFKQISATWTVPTATQAKSGQAEFSSSWVGIGGGCLNVTCLASDNTLVQAGTEQDVDSSGHASYSTWYEIIPAPSISAPVAIAPGQRVYVNVWQVVPGLWNIVIKNLTTGQSYSRNLPYTSSYASAEFIVETPLLIGAGGTGFSAMPRLSGMTFDSGLVNNASPHLIWTEGMQLVDTSGTAVLATPSSPDSDGDGFSDCTYATSCSAPAS